MSMSYFEFISLVNEETKIIPHIPFKGTEERMRNYAVVVSILIEILKIYEKSRSIRLCHVKSVLVILSLNEMC